MILRRAFTLIEILVIVAIMGTMITVSIVSVNAGKGTTRLRGATRDIFAIIRYARSTALVSQQPSIITYSCEMDGEEPIAKIEVVTAHEAKDDDEDAEIETLSGEPFVRKGDDEDMPKVTSLTKDGRSRVVNSSTNSVDSASDKEDSFQPISEDVVRGIRIKVIKEGDELEGSGDNGGKKSGISIFSNVDYLLGKYKSAKKSADADKSKSADAVNDSSAAVGTEELQEPVSIVWEVNGRVEPHRVYIYPDGSKPENGLSIKVDRFGAAKVLSPGEDDE